MNKFATTMIILALLALAGSAFSAEAETPYAAMLTKCSADLAKRLAVSPKEIGFVALTEVTWPDAALGMPEIGKAYAQVLTPGARILLSARNRQYLYTVSMKAFRFGGQTDLWACSLLAVQPSPDEANLNGDLYQYSWMGANPTRVAERVTAYYPQANGLLLVVERTSRSSHDLRLVAANDPARDCVLATAFDFATAALNDAGDSWTAVVRPSLGEAWQVFTVKMGEKPYPSLPLPAGVKSGALAWSGDTVVLLDPAAMRAYQATPAAAKPAWKAVGVDAYPGLPEMMLNKSESLDIAEFTDNGKPRVEVARVWFTGDRNLVATLPGLSLRGFDLCNQYALLWGELKGEPIAYAVDIATGETTPGVRNAGRDPKPFRFPPISNPLTVGVAQ